MTQSSWLGMTQSSWLGLIRPSASTRHSITRVIDGRVRPGHDGWGRPGHDGWGGGGVSDDGVKVRR
jgi:hypothetical protein